MKFFLHASFGLALFDLVVAQAADESVLSSIQYTTQIVTDVRTSIYPLTTWVSTHTDAQGSSFVVSSIGPGTVPVEIPTIAPSSTTSPTSTLLATSPSSSTAKSTLSPLSPIETSSTPTVSRNSPITTSKTADGVYTTTSEVTSTILACVEAGLSASDCMTTYTTTEIKTQQTTVYVTTTLDTTSSCATTSGISSCSSVTRTNVVTVTSLLPLGTAIATTQQTVAETVIATTTISPANSVTSSPRAITPSTSKPALTSSKISTTTSSEPGTSSSTSSTVTPLSSSPSISSTLTTVSPEPSPPTTSIPSTTLTSSSTSTPGASSSPSSTSLPPTSSSTPLPTSLSTTAPPLPIPTVSKAPITTTDLCNSQTYTYGGLLPTGYALSEGVTVVAGGTMYDVSPGMFTLGTGTATLPPPGETLLPVAAQKLKRSRFWRF
ncbi:hypothetical protein DL95DRAFT_520854 [Leptodontidium sp. 2 PMI_412]|nr:hypothetical protein DL95DRAFT_520854 [Leptodontidium sp. 2 PMI_412]